MIKSIKQIFFQIVMLSIMACPTFLSGQIISVGDGSYTDTFPGVDEANRNSFPSGTPQLSGEAVGKPVPTNDWWSKLIKENHANNLFNYPMTMKTFNSGLIVTYISSGPIGDSEPIKVTLSGLNASKTTVSDYSDWTVSMNWNDGTHDLNVTSGIGMPFLYFEKGTNDVLEIEVSSGNATISNEMLMIENASADADFVFYAPSGSSWTVDGTIYTSTLNGKDYWSMAMLPQDNSSVSSMANEYKKYAYVFPENTNTSWSYDEATSVLKTDFTITTSLKEGTATDFLQGLLPHQWDNLASNSAQPMEHSYSTIRGELKTLNGITFSTENTFKGILPTMPYLANYSEGFSPSELNSKIDLIKNDGLSTWTDSYNEGQVMNRLIQTARIADQTGDFEARDKMISTVKERLEDWLSYEQGEVAFLFYYNSDWSALLGYPSGHGQDNNINDHHFHWGYFIHAAAFMEQFEPGWSDKWGDMVNHLVRDAASQNRNDDKFPFLRNFSPYAGHCWANGFATFPQGNDQESTSESMQFNSSLIHWGTVTGNDEIRDLGIYLYTTEQTAIEEYWLDVYERNFRSDQQYSLVSRVWGNSYDNGTFWTADITASYGIELYPMHGGSLYLGHNLEYVQKLWNEIEANTDILSDNSVNPNLWHDTFWKVLSFIDPGKAVSLYDSYPDRIMKFGVSDAQTYHWLHAMNAMGTLRSDLTANYPIASAFEKDGLITYVAHNYSSNSINVVYSDGFQLEVPAQSMVTNRDSSVGGTITSNFQQAYLNGSVTLTVEAEGEGITKVEFFDGSKLIGEVASSPYQLKAQNLDIGIHKMYARVFTGENFNPTNIVTVQVGDQVPYFNNPVILPGTIEAGHYDKFEGGIGQGISYVDLSQNNQGDFRPNEYVDAIEVNNEGVTVGWISSGEWMEYSVLVGEAGVYDVEIRYASGNANGGGPFHFEIDGKVISDDILLNTTSDWGNWESKTISNIDLNKGDQVLRTVFDNGEFNLGKMTFTRTGNLSYSPPVADAGENVLVVLPEVMGLLDGSGSSDPEGEDLTYEWTQIYGPSEVNISDNTIASPTIGNLEEGIYKFDLMVSDGTYSSSSSVLVIVSTTSNVQPTVSITSPADGDAFKDGDNILIEVSASDLDGTISLVEFFDGTEKIGEDNNVPYELDWLATGIGPHEITASAVDNVGARITSSVVNISLQEVKSCSFTSSESSEGTFSIGYEATFESVGTSVTVTFELLDTDKSGVVALLRQNTPSFSETRMDQVEGNIFRKTISGFTVGSTYGFACKFEFAGGLAVTKYFDYQVGSGCGGGQDEEAPTDFTATLGTVGSRSVNLLLNAIDDSGKLVYTITYGSLFKTFSGNSNEELNASISGLQPNADYVFNVEVSDLAGNEAVNNPIMIAAKTTENVNTNCEGVESKAQQGSFEVGYNYNFETIGNDVDITFELLDQKNGVIAYLWTKSPFSEVQMTNIGDKKFSIKLPGETQGATISHAVKFAFEGGLAVTDYFDYVVGDNCGVEEPEDEIAPTEFSVIAGELTSNSIDLVLSANDNSDSVKYEITYGSVSKAILTKSNQSITEKIIDLDADTEYSFSVTVEDLSGNKAANNPIVLTAKTAVLADDDADGIPNDLDLCPDTPAGASVDETGCQDNLIILEMTETTFQIDENSIVGTEVGTPVVNYNGDENLSYSIVEGNSMNAFRITSTGMISVLNAVLDFEIQTKFDLKIAVTDGVTSDEAIMVIMINDLEETEPLALTELGNEVKIYPNPINSFLYLDMPDGENIKIDQIFDIQGKLYDVPSAIINNRYELDFTRLKSGLYFLQIKNTEGIVEQFKVIKR